MPKLMDYFKEKWTVLVSILAIIIFASVLFGITGFRTVGFWLLVYVIPSFMIYSLLGLDDLESFILGIFSATGLVPTLVFFMNFVIPSLRASTIVLFLIEIAIVVLLFRKYHPKHKDQ
jgi:hypothetical protein